MDTPTSGDLSRPAATERDREPEQIQERQGPTRPDASRSVAADLDISQHPYVRRLEGQVEKLEGELEAQVRRTEEIQQRAQDKLVELQRMTMIGQSKTLADFMLQATNWIVGAEADDATGYLCP